MTSSELIQYLNPLTDFVNTTLSLLQNMEEANAGDEEIEFGIELIKEGRFKEGLEILWNKQGDYRHADQ